MSVKHTLDLSRLEPPLPIEETLHAVETLPPGDYLRILYPREPIPLFAMLTQLELSYLSLPGPDHTWKLLIWHKGDREAEAAVRADAEAQGSRRP